MEVKAHAPVNSGCRRRRALILRFLFHVVMPISIGTAIYLLFRTTSLLVFDWLDAVTLLEPTIVARGMFSGISLPAWLLYSAPDGLWVYAITSWMILIWDRRPPLPWLLAGVALGVGGEIGQAIAMIPGTYQHLDVLFYVGGFWAACFFQLESFHESPYVLRSGIAGNDIVRVWERRHR